MHKQIEQAGLAVSGGCFVNFFHGPLAAARNTSLNILAAKLGTQITCTEYTNTLFSLIHTKHFAPPYSFSRQLMRLLYPRRRCRNVVGFCRLLHSREFLRTVEGKEHWVVGYRTMKPRTSDHRHEAARIL